MNADCRLTDNLRFIYYKILTFVFGFETKSGEILLLKNEYLNKNNEKSGYIEKI
jgi:hypothetical protein